MSYNWRCHRCNVEGWGDYRNHFCAKPPLGVPWHVNMHTAQVFGVVGLCAFGLFVMVATVHFTLKFW